MPDLASNLTSLVGVQTPPNNGYSIESKQILSENEARVKVGMQYSGSGKIYKDVDLVMEEGIWKISNFAVGG